MRRCMGTTDAERAGRIFHNGAAAAYRSAAEMGQAGGYDVIAADVFQADRWDCGKPVKGKDGGKRPALLGKEERDKVASDKGRQGPSNQRDAIPQGIPSCLPVRETRPDHPEGRARGRHGRLGDVCP